MAGRRWSGGVAGGGGSECSCAEPQLWVIHTPAPPPPQSIVQILLPTAPLDGKGGCCCSNASCPSLSHASNPWYLSSTLPHSYLSYPCHMFVPQLCCTSLSSLPHAPASSLITVRASCHHAVPLLRILEFQHSYTAPHVFGSVRASCSLSASTHASLCFVQILPHNLALHVSAHVKMPILTHLSHIHPLLSLSLSLVPSLSDPPRVSPPTLSSCPHFVSRPL